MEISMKSLEWRLINTIKKKKWGKETEIQSQQSRTLGQPEKPFLK